MLIDFRPHARLRREQPEDCFEASIVPVVTALKGSSTELSKVRVVGDWVHYRNNFRDVVDIRPILPGEDFEIAVDVRRANSSSIGELTSTLLSRQPDRVFLEEWGTGTESLVWRFNALYWSALDLWEKATGRGYEQALPGEESDARNRAAAGELILELFAAWDRLGADAALPEQLYIVELGVGNGGQAKVFLDEFRELDRRHGKGYYARLHYLMCDYSTHVLDLARETVAEHAERVSSFALDATRPRTSLGFMQGKAFLIYISNVYDNLPTDELAYLGGRTYQVHSRAYLPSEEAAALAASVSASVEELPGFVHKLLRLGPSLLADACPGHFPDVEAAIRFWQQAWSILRLDERYVPLSGLDSYTLTDSLTGETLRPLLESGADIRMHVSNGALASFEDSLALLHPFGKLVCHDLFVNDVGDYRTAFRGPGKYDGSVVNWVNGPLLAHVGRRRGFDVNYERFRHRNGGNIVTMTAQARD
ncbi:SAM-dependent methyltransferase [Nocardia pseudovaccinii]|uniref:SAM-dependent methyltransferase n=1 Tax=Nocardia pseudovaccinii TaxID=189540 RepID=UPI0007A4033E|nr:SAM-dependent methyltransferase [Nocardia pseudovaccinii]